MRVDQLLRSSPVDVWLLQEYGKFRKAMAKDETSLYRGVAEQASYETTINQFFLPMNKW